MESESAESQSKTEQKLLQFESLYVCPKCTVVFVIDEEEECPVCGRMGEFDEFEIVGARKEDE